MVRVGGLILQVLGRKLAEVPALFFAQNCKTFYLNIFLVKEFLLKIKAKQYLSSKRIRFEFENY